MPDFATFTASGHEYTLGDRLVPSVTQTMALAGLDPYARIPRRNLIRPAAIGTAVHLATHFLDEGDLILESLDPAIVGYVLAWQRFKQEEDFTPIEIERRGISVGENGELPFGYCLDRIGVLADKETLVDIKTPKKISDFMELCYSVQTAGYCRGANFEGARASVQLREDGTYRLIPHTNDARDFQRWQSALELAHDKLAAGVRIPQ